MSPRLAGMSVPITTQRTHTTSKYGLVKVIPRRRNNDEKIYAAIIGGFCSGAILFYGWRWYYGRRRIRNFDLTNDDLNYSDHSPEELVSEHLIDLNSANADQLTELGLSAETHERLIENRPYRTKLELVSRIVLSPDEYAAIKDRVSVAEANESVKIA